MHKILHSSFSLQLAGQESIYTGLQPAVGTYHTSSVPSAEGSSEEDVKRSALNNPLETSLSSP